MVKESKKNKNKIVVHPYHGLMLINEGEQRTDACDCSDESYGIMLHEKKKQHS